MTFKHYLGGVVFGYTEKRGEDLAVILCGQSGNKIRTYVDPQKDMNAYIKSAMKTVGAVNHEQKIKLRQKLEELVYAPVSS